MEETSSDRRLGIQASKKPTDPRNRGVGENNARASWTSTMGFYSTSSYLVEPDAAYGGSMWIGPGGTKLRGISASHRAKPHHSPEPEETQEMPVQPNEYVIFGADPELEVEHGVDHSSESAIRPDQYGMHGMERHLNEQAPNESDPSFAADEIYASFFSGEEAAFAENFCGAPSRRSRSFFDRGSDTGSDHSENLDGSDSESSCGDIEFGNTAWDHDGAYIGPAMVYAQEQLAEPTTFMRLWEELNGLSLHTRVFPRPWAVNLADYFIPPGLWRSEFSGEPPLIYAREEGASAQFRGMYVRLVI